MAQIVKLEPGDVLVLTRLGAETLDTLTDDESVRDLMVKLKEDLGLRAILCFEGDACDLQMAALTVRESGDPELPGSFTDAWRDRLKLPIPDDGRD